MTVAFGLAGGQGRQSLLSFPSIPKTHSLFPVILSLPHRPAQHEQAVDDEHSTTAGHRSRPRFPQPSLRRHHRPMHSCPFRQPDHLHQYRLFSYRRCQPPPVYSKQCRLDHAQVCLGVSRHVAWQGCLPTTHLPACQQRILPYEAHNSRPVHSHQVR